MEGQSHQSTIYSTLLSFSGAIKSVFSGSVTCPHTAFLHLSVYIFPKLICRNYLVAPEPQFSSPSRGTQMDSAWVKCPSQVQSAVAGRWGHVVQTWLPALHTGGLDCPSGVVPGVGAELPSLCLSSWSIQHGLMRVSLGMFSVASNRILN